MRGAARQLKLLRALEDLKRIRGEEQWVAQAAMSSSEWRIPRTSKTGKLASGDGELVDEAISIIKQLGGAVASPDEARPILGLEKRNHAKL
jgi:uncharacterized protein (DUF849 family)